MENSKVILEVYQEWLITLPPEEQQWCRRAVKNLARKMRNIGEMNACEVLIAVLLFYQRIRLRAERAERLQAYLDSLNDSGAPAAVQGGLP